jgi:hypothetical protein
MPVEIAAAAQPELAALPPPIFVLGTRPAGTSLVAAMIGRNPAAFDVPRLNLFAGDTLEAMLKGVFEPGQNHVHGLLRAVAYLYGSEQTIISVGMARRWLFRRLSWPTGRVFDELRGRVAPRRLVDKSVVYSRDANCLARIRESVPDAFYIHVVEHPLTPGAVAARMDIKAIIEDLRQRGGRGGRDANATPDEQLKWFNAQSLIAGAINRVAPEKRAILRMDRLLADPSAELTALCQRLDLPHGEADVAAMLHPENSPFAGLGPVGANLGDDPDFLQNPTFPPNAVPAGLPPQAEKQILPEVAQFAAQYGYE